MLRSIRFGALLTVLALAGCNFGSSEKAEIRLLNVSQDYSSLDFYVDDDRKAEAVSYGTVSGYISLDEDTYTIGFAAHNSSSKLATESKKLSKETHTTFIGYGRSGSFGSFEIDEDQDKPDSDKTKLLVLNGATDAGDLDIYLTGDSEALADSSPVSSDLGAGTKAGDYITISSGTYRLRVTAAGSTSDVRLDVSNVNFSSKQVGALVVTDTGSGVLVNAIFLAQQESLAFYKNPKARIRAVVGMAAGSAVTAKIAGTTLVSNAAAKTVGIYKQVDAGSDSVDVTVDANAVTVANQTLTSGNDYTLLLWSNSDGTQTTLVTDDNRLPLEDSNTKIRVLNAMSALAAPITLSVDYYPVAENIAVGQASGYTELSSTSDSQLDVSNANTSSVLYTQTGTSLSSKSVYTMFMFGGSSSASGVLRKER